MAHLGNMINIWKTADAVTFDVDSTVTTEEGIDELAKFCGKGEQIVELYVFYLTFTKARVGKILKIMRYRYFR